MGLSFCFAHLLSCVQLFVTLWIAAYQASLCFTTSHSFLKFISVELVMLSNHLILCFPLLLASGSFSMSWLYTSGGQCVGASASASKFLPLENSKDTCLEVGKVSLYSICSYEVRKHLEDSNITVRLSEPNNHRQSICVHSAGILK